MIYLDTEGGQYARWDRRCLIKNPLIKIKNEKKKNKKRLAKKKKLVLATYLKVR